MEINIHIKSTYDVSHSKEIEKMYGFTPIKRSKSYNIPLSISKNSCSDVEKLKCVLVNSGVDSTNIRIILESIKQDNTRDEDIKNMLLKTLSRDNSPRSTLQGIQVITPRAISIGEKEFNKIENPLLSIIFESSNLKIKWYHKFFKCFGC